MTRKMSDLHEIQLSLFDKDEDIITYNNGEIVSVGVHGLFLNEQEFQRVSKTVRGEFDA